MLAFHDRLLRKGEDDPDSLYPGLMATDVAATVGHEPNGLSSLTLDQWVEFMMGRKYSPRSWKPGT